MNHLPPASSSLTHGSNAARWGLTLAAGVVGVFMLVYYVQLLQDAVARGDQWRYSQSATSSTAKSAPPARIRLVSTAH